MQTSLYKESLFARWMGYFWYPVSHRIDDTIQKSRHGTIIRISQKWMNGEERKKSDILVRQSGERAESYLLSLFRSIYFFLILPSYSSFSMRFQAFSDVLNRMVSYPFRLTKSNIGLYFIMFTFDLFSVSLWKEPAKRESVGMAE